MILTGVCKFCGQVHAVEVDAKDEEEVLQSDLDYQAMLLCDCDLAKHAKIVEKSRLNAHTNIDALFSEFGEMTSLLKLSADLIAKDEITGITVTTDSNVTATVKTAAAGMIKVERKETKKVSATA